MKRFIERNFRSYELKPGNRISANIGNAHRTIVSARLVLSGTLDLTASAVKSLSGGLARFIKNIELTASGYDVATNSVKNVETRMNLEGSLLAYCAASAAIGGSNRINILDPFTPMITNSAMIQDINATSLAAQDFEIDLQIPFFAPNGRNPRDLNVDTSQMQNFNLDIEMAQMSELFSTATTPSDSVLSNGKLDIYLTELQQVDRLQGTGGADYPAGYVRYSTEVINVEADNSEYRKQFTVQGNLMQVAFICTDSDGDAADDMIESIRLERNNQVYYDMPAKRVRAQNMRTYALHPTTAVTGKNIFSDSGLYLVCPGSDNYSNRVYLGDMQFLGRADDSSQYVLSIKAPSSGKGTIKIITSALVSGDALSVVNTPYNEQTPAVRDSDAAKKFRAEKNARSLEIQNMAAAQQ